MRQADLNEKTHVELSVGHLLIVWNIFSNKLSGLNFNNEFSNEDKHALWALEDICEEALIKNGIDPMSKEEWDKIIEMAAEHVKTLPVEFLD